MAALSRIVGKSLVALVAASLLVACTNDTDPKSSNNGDNNGATNNGATNNGATNNGATNNGATNNGATNNGATNSGQPTVFYYEHVKPIVDARCTACHVAGGIGPFVLDTYDAVTAVGELVQAAVVNKVMPPYITDADCREYKYHFNLSDEQIQTVSDWVDQGMPEGEAAAEGDAIVDELPAPPDFDVELFSAEAYEPTKTPDDYRCFVLDWPYDTDRFVTGFGVDPDQDPIVHHVIAFLTSPENVAEAQALDAAEDGPGYTCFGGPGFNSTGVGWLGSWAPGGVPSKYPEGTGVRVEAGSKVVVQVHYNTLVDSAVADQTKVLFETSETVDKEGYWMPWANPGWLSGTTMRIPAGEADATHRFAIDPTRFINASGIDIWSGGLHMHLLGTSARAEIVRSNGDVDCLVDVPRWDFNWQSGVRFEQPARLNNGDRLALECHWDNTMENQPIVDGTRITPADRFWGEGTTDEMCLGVFYITVVP